MGRGRTMGAVIAALTCWAGVAASSAPAADWTQYRFDAAQSGRNPLETVLMPATVGQLQQRWTARAGDEILWAAPLVLGDETVVTAAPHTVAAFRTSTGAPLWSTQVS